MRQINWDEALSDEDISFLRMMGVVGMEERIQGHQGQFGLEVVPEDVPGDSLTVSALDAQARASTPVLSGDGPKLVDPTKTEDELVDDYDQWKIAELEAEVKNRNSLEDTSDVTIVGTGKDGKVLKAGLIEGLRVWDRENPETPS